jgi:Domain of Unknown Function (DUF1080)
MAKNSLLFLAFVACAAPLFAQTPVPVAAPPAPAPITALSKPEFTEFWIPEPHIVTPAAPQAPAPAPSDAIVLFDGKNLDAFTDLKGEPAKWKLDGESMTVVKGAGDVQTKQSFGDYQLHIEWRSPIETEELLGQQKGNSGIFMQSRYEVQVLNSYKNRTYSNGQAASIYKQTPPLVNACQKMGDWNVYDIIYTAPRFRMNGSVEKSGFVTVIHNGIVVQNHTEIQGTTEYIGAPKNIAHGDAPIKLQDHGNAVSYRNIWIRKM